MTRSWDCSSHTMTKIIADIFISLAWEFFIFIFLEKKIISTYTAANAQSLLFHVLLTDCPQRSIAIQKVIWYIQILLHYPIIIIILRVFRHICYGNGSSDGCAVPLPWHPESVLHRAVTIHQVNLKDHNRTWPQASMLLFNKTTMLHSSSAAVPVRKVWGGCSFLPNRRTRETHPLRDLWMWGHRNVNGFPKVKGQIQETHTSFIT